MAIQEQLQQDLKSAMRGGEKQRVEVIRMVLAAIKNAQIAQVKQAYDAQAATTEDESEITVDRTTGLSEDAVLDTLKKEAKRRREAAEIYRNASRPELAEAEEAEAAIIDTYLPRQMSADELRPLVAAKLSELGTVGPSDMGKIMPVLMKEFKPLADGRMINQVVRELLSAR